MVLILGVTLIQLAQVLGPKHRVMLLSEIFVIGATELAVAEGVLDPWDTEVPSIGFWTLPSNDPIPRC